MRIYLLPLSTRRSLIYAQRLNQTTHQTETGLLNKAVASAARLWTKWEAKEKGWQRKVVDYGNQAMRRIPFEEWGLKSVPPLSTRKKTEELEGTDKVELVFPGRMLENGGKEAVEIAGRLAKEREGYHRKTMIWCFVGMPLSAPFALIPVIPNLPFFYLVFRAWSHWRAIAGGKHIQWLVERNLLQPKASPLLDGLYETAKTSVPLTAKVATRSQEGRVEGQVGHSGERMLLTQQQVKGFADALEIPALTLELERAIWQVEEAVKKDRKADIAAEETDAAAASTETLPPSEVVSEKTKQ